MSALYNFGRTIYYDKLTGYVIYDSRDVSHTDPNYKTKLNPYVNIKALSERVRSTVGEIELPYGQFSNQFNACDSYSVNLNTLTVDFVFLNEPSIPPTTEPSLESRVELIEETLDFILMNVNGGM